MDGEVGSSRRERLAGLQGTEVLRVRRHPGYRRIDLLRGMVGPTPISVLNFTAPQVMAVIEGIMRENHFDSMQVEGVHLLAYARRIRQLAPGVPLVCDWHNIESEIQHRYAQTSKNPARRLYARRTAGLLRGAEREYLQLGDAHTVCSERERQVLLAEAPDAYVSVIPNGVDTAFFAAGAADEGPRQDVVFVGSMDYHANIDAVTYFAKTAWPALRERRPEWRFVIVGSRPAPEVMGLANEAGIVVTGTVEDVRPYYRKAALVVVPLRVGSGTRLKVLEAMAAGVPVISTRLGAEGLAVTHGKDILIAETPAEMADAAASLQPSNQRWNELAANGLRLVQTQYEWSVIGKKLVDIHAGLLARQTDANAAGVREQTSRV